MEILPLLLFAWIGWGALKLALKLTWGLAKVVAVLLMVAALPLLLVCLAVFGAFALLVPIGLVALAWGIPKLFC